jgi:carotenoid cleavage dioxygenase-like enzyme
MSAARYAAAERDRPPFYLRDNFAPVSEEVTVCDLPVAGCIPESLSGRYLRNGPNPRGADPGHWFLGDGMIHGVALHRGRAAWYRNRWVRTGGLDPHDYRRSDGAHDLSVGLANTSVIGHAGRILALVESSWPTALSPDLDTLGCIDFGGRLSTGMTAHPKVCPATGELHFFGYGVTPPYLTYHRADATGQLQLSRAVDLAGPAMVHDFAITERHVVIFDLPILFDTGLARAGEAFPYRWSDTYGARVGLLRRGEESAPVRWLEVSPGYVFHVVNAFEEATNLVVDAVRLPELWRHSRHRYTQGALHRWTIDLALGAVREQALDDRGVEFPRIDERRTGRPHRFSYYVEQRVNDAGEPKAGQVLLKHDRASGVFEAHDFGPQRVPGEPVFVPREARSDEDGGWLLSYVYDRTEDRSDLVILDARDVAGEPVAVVSLPRRVPYGFHGSWIADAA